MITFKKWFMECILCAIQDKNTPDDYLWDLENCENWKHKFNLGMSPSDAVNSEFFKQ